MLKQLLSNSLIRLLALSVLFGFLASNIKAGISLILVITINLLVFYFVRRQAKGVLAKAKAKQAKIHIPPLEQHVAWSTTRFLPVLFIAELALLAIAGQAGLSAGVAFGYAAALLVAGLPSGFALTQVATARFAKSKDNAVLLRNLLHNTTTDNASLFTLVAISLFSAALYHTALAIGIVQLLTFSLLLQLFPYVGLAWDEKPHTVHEPKRVTVGFSLLTAGLAFANFIFYFLRNGLSARHVDMANPYYMKASALALLTLFVCQGLHLLFTRAHARKRFFTAYLWANSRLWLGFGLSIFVFANMVYNPLVRGFFGGAPLSLTDWLWAIMAGVIYMTVKLLQRHTRKHARHVVLELHRSKQAI
jgi:hypothetical protein